MCRLRGRWDLFVFLCSTLQQEPKHTAASTFTFVTTRVVPITPSPPARMDPDNYDFTNGLNYSIHILIYVLRGEQNTRSET